MLQGTSHTSSHMPAITFVGKLQGLESSVAVNFHNQKPCWSHYVLVFSVVKPNEFLNMTWQPKKTSNTAVPQHTTVTRPTRGSLFFSGFCLHQGLKATTSSCQAATWQAPNGALQSTSFTYWKIGLDSDPFIHDLKSKVVSIIPDVELLYLQTFFPGLYIWYIYHILVSFPCDKIREHPRTLQMVSLYEFPFRPHRCLNVCFFPPPSAGSHWL